jgi:hypothetical protein
MWAARIRERHADERASVLRREPTVALATDEAADGTDGTVARAGIATVFRERGLHVAERVRHAETQGVRLVERARRERADHRRDARLEFAFELALIELLPLDERRDDRDAPRDERRGRADEPRTATRETRGVEERRDGAQVRLLVAAYPHLAVHGGVHVVGELAPLGRLLTFGASLGAHSFAHAKKWQ